VRRAFLRDGQLAKIIARGSGLAFTLNEAAQGSLDVSLRVGARGYCSHFGGLVRVDLPNRFRAVHAPPPGVCAD
jgi:hypothetical protein